MDINFPKHIRAVLWDMDGTLINSEPTAIKALYKAAQQAGINLPRQIQEEVIGMAADKIYEWFCNDFGLKMEQFDWEKLKQQLYFLDSENISAFPKALQTWNALEAAGVCQAIVSNSARSIVDFNCRHIGIDGPDLISISRDDVSNGKPDPEGYLQAAKTLGVRPQECVVLEDSLPGLEAGLAAGMFTYCVLHSTNVDLDEKFQTCELSALTQALIELSPASDQ